MDEPPTIDLSLRLLDWYREMGVDAALGETAVDWVARGNVKPGAAFVVPQTSAYGSGGASNVTPTSAPLRAPEPARAREPSRDPVPRELATPRLPPARVFAPATPDAAVAAARAAAREAVTIDDLGAILERFNGCGLKATAKNLCFYRGAPTTKLMVIGEAPGRDEDLSGVPFSGPAGALLDKMLAAIGYVGANCHITNAVYWRPPGNRLPTPQELDVCRPFIERQIELVKPELVLLLGATAAKQVLDIGESLVRARGNLRDAQFGEHKVRALVTYHPNYLLKMPAHKHLIWRDLLSVKAALAR